jgi:hypothetical protein
MSLRLDTAVDDAIVVTSRMALRLGAPQDALLDAGASPAKADKAVEEVAGHDRQMTDVRSDLTLIKWMLGFQTALALGLFWMTFNILTRLPR